MELTLIHLYPDLMNLYGSYANLSVLRRTLEGLGHSVTVQPVLPGESVALDGCHFLYLGAGTERAQKAALEALTPYAAVLRSAAEAGLPMLFAGSAMELLGRRITDQRGKDWEALGLADFLSRETEKRFVEDVYGVCPLFPEPIVGFQNKSAVITGVETPLLTGVAMGYGNDGEKRPDGSQEKNVFASALTGPILVKNPALLREVSRRVLAYAGAEMPESIPVDEELEKGYAVTAEQLRRRAEG